MALSDQLSKLADRAKEAETRTSAAHDKAKADVQKDVATARASAEANAKKLQETTDATKGNISDAWNKHLAAVRDDIDDKRAAHDLKQARRTADDAGADAQFAIDFAYAAIEEAEYAVLDADLAQMDADELEQTA
jgi:hypothetical protein